MEEPEVVEDKVVQNQGTEGSIGSLDDPFSNQKQDDKVEEVQEEDNDWT